MDIKQVKPEIHSQIDFYEAQISGYNFKFCIIDYKFDSKISDFLFLNNHKIVVLLNQTRLNYPLNLDAPALDWEYIADKFNLSEEIAVNFTKVLSKVIRTEVQIFC